MAGNLEQQEMAQLLAIPAFRRLIWRIISEAGILTSAYGTDGRDLPYREGRRSLGLDILRWVELAHQTQHPDAIRVLLAVLSEEESTLKEQPRDRRSRHDRDDDDR